MAQHAPASVAVLLSAVSPRPALRRKTRSQEVWRARDVSCSVCTDACSPSRVRDACCDTTGVVRERRLTAQQAPAWQRRWSPRKNDMPGRRPEEAPPPEEEAAASSSGSAQEDALAAGALLAAGLGVVFLLKRVLFPGTRGAAAPAPPAPPGGNPSKRQPRGAVASWSVHGVADFLHSLDLPQHVPAFLDNAVDGALLLQLTTEDLMELGVVRRVHRVRAPRCRVALSQEHATPQPSATPRRLTRPVLRASQKKIRLRLGLPLEEDDGASSLAVRGPTCFERASAQNTGAAQPVCHPCHRHCWPCASCPCGCTLQSRCLTTRATAPVPRPPHPFQHRVAPSSTPWSAGG